MFASTLPDPRRGRRRRHRVPRRHRRVMLSQETAIGLYPVDSWRSSPDRRTTDPAAPIAVERAPRAPRRPRSLVHGGPPRAAPRTSSARRARHPDAVGPLGAARLAHPPTVPIYALSPGPATVRRCRFMWACAPRRCAATSHRAPHHRLRPARRRARLAEAGPALGSPQACPTGAPAARHCCRSSSCNVAPCSPRRPWSGSGARARRSTAGRRSLAPRGVPRPLPRRLAVHELGPAGRARPPASPRGRRRRADVDFEASRRPTDAIVDRVAQRPAPAAHTYAFSSTRSRRRSRRRRGAAFAPRFELHSRGRSSTRTTSTLTRSHLEHQSRAYVLRLEALLEGDPRVA